MSVSTLNPLHCDSQHFKIPHTLSTTDTRTYFLPVSRGPRISIVFDDTEMGTEHISPRDPFGIHTEADEQDQSGAGLQDFNMDDLVDLGGDTNLFGSPSVEKTDFDFSFGSTEPDDNGQAGAAQPTAQVEEAGKAIKNTKSQLTMPDSAPFLLTLSQDPMLSEEAVNCTDDQLTVLDSSLACFESGSAPVIDSNQPIPSQTGAERNLAPGQTTVESAGYSISDSDLAFLDASLMANGNYVPQLQNAPVKVGSSAMSSYMPQQPYTAQPQQLRSPPNLVEMSGQRMYMPVPQRVLPPRNIVGTPQRYPSTAPRQQYMAAPPGVRSQDLVRMSQTYYTNPHPVIARANVPYSQTLPLSGRAANNGHPAPPSYRSYQQLSPGVMSPEFPTSYAPPQPQLPQLANGHLQPATNLYQPYVGGHIDSERKRGADDDHALPPTKKIRHRREGNRRESNDPSHWYQPLPLKPTDWSPPPKKDPSGRPGSPPPRAYKEPLFRYNDQGEWLGNVRYTRQELEAFLVGPRGDGKAPSRKGKLTMWIQCAPAFDLHRYGAQASICRWDECPVKKNTISKGQFRVAFDEHADLSGTATDPFHCAGYMHLYCFEEAFGLYGFFFDGRFCIQPDRRFFRHEERNPMALGGTLVGVLDAWIQSEGRRLRERRRRGVGDRATPRERRLWYVLTRAHTAGPGYLEGLERRNDIHVGRYMGDLELYQQLKDEKLRMEREARVVELEDDEDVQEVFAPVSQTSNSKQAGPGQVAMPQPRRPTLPSCSPLATRKRSRAVDEDEAPACTASSPKRLEVDTDVVAAEVRKKLPKRSQQDVRRVSRILTSMVTAIDGMPHYKRLEVESLVTREADRVRSGVVPRWGSLPTELGCRT